MSSICTSLRGAGLLVAALAILNACGDDRREQGASGTGAGSAGWGGAGGTASAGSGGTFAGSGGVSGMAGSGGVSGVSGGAGGTAGSSAGAGGTSGTGGSAGDAGASMVCPAGFECVTDPIFNLLSGCLPMGGGLPPECMTDADCIAAGLPGATCLVEMELGVTGCAQICTP